VTFFGQRRFIGMRRSYYYHAQADHARRLADITVQPNVEEILRRVAEELDHLAGAVAVGEGFQRFRNVAGAKAIAQATSADDLAPLRRDVTRAQGESRLVGSLFPLQKTLTGEQSEQPGGEVICSRLISSAC
jgi:hypothetical protein